MARTPNYSFERKERERLKAEKKAKRAAEKQAARDAQTGSEDPNADSGTEDTKTTPSE